MIENNQQNLCKIRTITTFLTLTGDQSQWKKHITKATACCSLLSTALTRQGYPVQSVRIVTNPFGEYLDTTSLATARQGLLYLRTLLNDLLQTDDLRDVRIRLAIGEATSSSEIKLAPQLIKEFGDLCNICVNISQDTFGVLDNARIEQAANAVIDISQITPRGEGNFNFTVNFNCDPLIPYFPASYFHSDQENCFVVGLETPDLLVDALKSFNNNTKTKNHNEHYRGYFGAMRSALQFHISAINSIIQRTEIVDFRFAGFDSSAAPSKSCNSMVEVYKQMGVNYFGAAGTVEASSLLTKVFQSIEGVPLVGFSGLMLALTEDTGLAAGTLRSEFDIRALLTYSAVCGIGLDTVPIPGDTPIEKISALMRDTGTMAFRLNKPLTVRLFPVPGLKAGEMTAFESDDLCNCAVLAVP